MWRRLPDGMTRLACMLRLPRPVLRSDCRMQRAGIGLPGIAGLTTRHGLNWISMVMISLRLRWVKCCCRGMG